MRANLSEVLEHFEENAPKGEFVLIISGKEEEKEEELTLSDATKLAKKLIESGESVSSAAKQAAAASGIKKSEIYKSLIEG
jgi:16S rRNA (cytidine1402-2'-O)-methyltransferase